MVPPAGVAHLVERDLAKVEVASSSLVARSKKKHHPSGWCFLFGMPRAGLNSLPRPARSALNQEVRQGSCEWLCHSWDAGSESSFVTLFAFAVCEAYKQQNLWAVTKKKDTHMGVFLFVSRKPLAGRVVQKRLLPMRKNKTPAVIVEMRSGNCKLQNKGRPFKNEVAETV